jgi:hypothetical protein
MSILKLCCYLGCVLIRIAFFILIAIEGFVLMGVMFHFLERTGVIISIIILGIYN